MSKIFSKTVKKTTLWSVILAVVLAAAIVVGALFGFHQSAVKQDAKSLTVSMNTFVYNTKKAEVIADCEDTFDEYNFTVKYTLDGAMDGDECEIVFVFAKDVDLTSVEGVLQDVFNEKTKDGGVWEGSFIEVRWADEVSVAMIAKHFVLRAAIAVVVFAVLAFAYAAIRYQSVWVGGVLGVSVLLSMALTAGLLVLTRTYVTASSAAAVAVAGLLTATSVLLTMNKISAASKEHEGAKEALVADSVAAKETLILGVSLAVAMVLVGALGKTAVAWFAVSALLGIISFLFVSLFFAPAMYNFLQAVADKKPARDAYVGAKKTSTKEKKTFVKKQAAPAPVEEAAEEPVEEAAEEPVEEAPAEEVSEESVEEAPTEEVSEESVEEAPAEEVAEESVEEAPAEESTEE